MAVLNSILSYNIATFWYSAVLHYVLKTVIKTNMAVLFCAIDS